MYGGLWYTAQTSGSAWDGYGGSFKEFEKLSDGYARYYKDITVPEGKTKAKMYIQLEQSSDNYTTAWSVADMHVIKLGAAVTIPKGSTGNKSYTAQWTANELTFGNQTKSAFYSSTTAQNVAITAATNGTGTYTYSISSQKNSSNTAVTGFSISGTNIVVAKTTAVGTYTVVVKATDSGSSKTKEATYTITVKYPKLTLNGNGGTATQSAVYTKYGTTLKYTTATGSTAGTIGATRTEYKLNGWYTQASGGTKVLNADGTGTGTAVSGYTNASKQWVMTADKTLYAQWTQYEAKIVLGSNTTYYETLQEAIDVAGANRTNVYLLKDVTYSTSLQFSNSAFLLDLGGFTITSTANYAVRINEGNGLIIRNGTINHTYTSSGVCINNYSSGKNISLYDLNVKSTNGTGINNISGTVSIRDGEIIAGEYCIDNNAEGNTTINGSTSSSPIITTSNSNNIAIRASGQVNINSGTITGRLYLWGGEIVIGSSSGNALSAYPWIKADTNVIGSGKSGSYIYNAGTIETTTDKEWKTHDIIIRSGYTTSVKSSGNGVKVNLVASTSTAAAKSTYSLINSNSIASQNNNNNKEMTEENNTTNQIKIGSKEYETIEKAIQDAKNNEEIILTEDINTKEKIVIPEETKAIINLNSHTITSESEEVIENNGTILIKDTKDGKIIGKIINNKELELEDVEIINKEKLDEENIKDIEDTTEDFDKTDIEAILKRKEITLSNQKGKITINGAKIINNSNEGIVIYNSEKAETEFKKGEIIATGSKAIGILNQKGTVIIKTEKEDDNEPIIKAEEENSIGIYNIETGTLEMSQVIVTAPEPLIGDFSKILEGNKIRIEELERIKRINRLIIVKKEEEEEE